MNTIIIRSVDKNSIFRREQVKEFEYDETELCFSDEAQDHIELLLMMNHSFTVDFLTKDRERAAQFFNAILCRASGHDALIGNGT